MKAAKQIARMARTPGVKACSGENEAKLMPCGAATGKDSNAHDGQDGGFGDEQDPQDLGADVDAAVSKEPDGCDGNQGHYRPWHVQAEERAEHGLGLDGEQPVDADLQAVVGNDRQDG